MKVAVFSEIDFILIEADSIEAVYNEINDLAHSYIENIERIQDELLSATTDAEIIAIKYTPYSIDFNGVLVWAPRYVKVIALNPMQFEYRVENFECLESPEWSSIIPPDEIDLDSDDTTNVVLGDPNV